MGRRLVVDTETDGLLYQLSMIHNIGIKDYDTGEKFMFTSRKGNIKEGVAMMEEAEAIIGHNILGFDLKAVDKVYPDFNFEGIVKDTLIISRLLWSNRADLDMKLIRAGTLEGKHMGRHSLESWGDRLGDPKGDFSQWCKDRDIDPWGDWGWEGTYDFKGKTIKEKGCEDRIIEPEVIQWSDVYDMRTDYCDQDVDVCHLLFDYELDTIDLWDMPSLPSYIEHRFEEIMQFCQEDGFPLNREKAEDLERDILEHLEDFQQQCAEAFPPAYVPQDGYMLASEVQDKYDHLIAKQDERVLKANQRGKTIKTYTYQPLLDFIAFIEEEEMTELPRISVAARTSKVTHKFPDGSTLKHVVEAGTVKTKVLYKEFNPNSRPQIIEKLVDLGWEPEEYTPAGNPSTAGDILEVAANLIPICKPIAGGLKCTNIKGYIRSKEDKKDKKGWLDVVGADGNIHARTVHIGATTHRVAISRPNTGQIPAIEMHPKGHENEGEYIKGFEGGWGYECRDCFEAPEGWVLLGTDLAGIEVRLLAEEMKEFDGGEYIDEVLDGDIHTKNQEAAELPTRGKAKTFLYAVIYGIGALKLGGSLDPSLDEQGKIKLGKSSKKKFFRTIPAAKKTIKKYEKQSKRGYIDGLDGRRIPVDSGHKALNYKLQNGGALIAKLWTIYVFDALLEEGYKPGYDGDFAIAAFVHDELQIPCRTEEIAERAGQITTEQSLIVGQFFGISIPIESNYKIGKSWAETH